MGVIFLCLLFLGFTLWQAGIFLVVSDPLEPSDAIAILSGGDATRIQEAVSLFNQLKSGYIIITNTGVKVPEWNTTYTELVKLQLIDAGVPAQYILVTEQSVNSTVEEARSIRKLMNQHNMHSVVVVTDPFHTFRTRLIFKDQFKDTDIRLAVTPARQHWYNPNTWWLSPRGIYVTVQEYAKLSFYLLLKILPPGINGLLTKFL